MIRTEIRMPPRSAFDNFRRDSESRIEAAALIATDGAARDALRDVRGAMAAAGLNRLGQALGYGSDLKRGRVFRRAGGFSVSGEVHIRSGSERSRGALEAYASGAEITPVRGRWLWIATDEIPNRAGRYRMTPERYRAGGFEQKIGPLFQIRGINGYPLLVVKNASVSASGLKRKARSLTKSGRARKGQREKALIVAFIGIPRTRRAARIDMPAIARVQAATLPQRINRELERR